MVSLHRRGQEGWRVYLINGKYGSNIHRHCNVNVYTWIQWPEDVFYITSI